MYENARAGLDVFENEPIQQDHALIQLDNVIRLPHKGSASMDTRTAMISLCLENLQNVLTGSKAKTPVDKGRYKKGSHC